MILFPYSVKLPQSVLSGFFLISPAFASELAPGAYLIIQTSRWGFLTTALLFLCQDAFTFFDPDFYS